jgi:DNA-binding CsgD family transcriptional regulator
MTKEEHAKITTAMIAMKRRGYTYREIAREFGMTGQGVYVRLRNHLTPAERARPGMRSLYTDAQWEWIVERYKEGHTHADLAAFLGLSEHTVGYHLRGIERNVRIPLEERKAEFNRLAGEGDAQA